MFNSRIGDNLITTASWVVAFIVVLLSGGCGIPSYVYLEEPSIAISSSLGDAIKAVAFNNRTTNNPQVFRGYVFYYKFYDSSDELEKETKAVKDSSTSSLQSLHSRDYHQIYRVDVESEKVEEVAPLVLLTDEEKSKAFRISVDFRDDVTPLDVPGKFDSFVSYEGKKIYICRYPFQNRETKTSQDQIERSFKLDDFDEADGDIPKGYTFGDSLYMALFVLSHGRDLSPIHSKPSYLGAFTFDGIEKL